MPTAIVSVSESPGRISASSSQQRIPRFSVPEIFDERKGGLLDCERERQFFPEAQVLDICIFRTRSVFEPFKNSLFGCTKVNCYLID
jgi:hypothetical protein